MASAGLRVISGVHAPYAQSMQMHVEGSVNSRHHHTNPTFPTSRVIQLKTTCGLDVEYNEGEYCHVPVVFLQLGEESTHGQKECPNCNENSASNVRTH